MKRAREARSFWGALMLTVSATAVAGRAWATDEISVSLDYDAAPGLSDCPTAAEFSKEVARHLRRDPFRDGASPHLTVHLYPMPAGLGARMEWRDAQGEWEGKRTFTARSQSCAAMARTVELATAIQIELLATLGAVSTAAPQPPDAESAAPPALPAPGLADAPAAVAPVGPGEPWFGVFVGGGVLRDLADAPTFPAARLGLVLGRPGVLALRLAVAGLGPGIPVTGLEGTAQLDRFVTTLEVVAWFRAERRLHPLAAAGIGLQDVRIRGTSAMPSLAAAHDGQRLSGVLTAGGGLGWALARRLWLVIEADAFFFRPSVPVLIGHATVADLNGAAVFIHGGLLARF